MANQRKNAKKSEERAKTERLPAKASSKTSVRRTTGVSAAKRRKKRMPPKQYGAIALAVMGLAVLLGIAVYFKNSGALLSGIRYFLFGSIGISAYLLPLLLFVAALFKAFNQGNQRLDDKIKLASLALFDLSVFVHILFVSQPQIGMVVGREYMFFPALANYFRVSARYQRGGGFVGGLFGDGILILLGKWGGIVFVVLLFLLILLILTEMSFARIMTFLGNLFHKLYLWIKQRISERREIEKERKKASQSWEQNIVEAELAERGAAREDFAAEKRAAEGEKKKKRSFINVELFGKAEELEDALPETEASVQDSEEAQKESFEEKGDLEKASASLEQEGEKAAEAGSQKEIADSEPLTEPARTSADALAGKIEAKPEKEQEAPEKGKPAGKAKQEPEEAAPDKAGAGAADLKKGIQEELELKQSIRSYFFPPLELLKEPKLKAEGESGLIEGNVQKLEETLQSFGVSAKVINVSQGPTVTRYEIQPAQGVKVSRIVNLADDIALNLAAAGIRMEAPIPGKSAIGIEVPNREAGSVMLREVIDSAEFRKSGTKLSFGLGKDITGRVLVTDIAKMPHLLIAGATGSGKSVCINTLIVSLLYKAKPEEVRLLMIDPKVVELSIYNGIPHLLIPVVTDAKKAAGALNWAVQEMNDRYKLFAAAGVRDLKGYNQAVEEKGDTPKLPQIVIIVDELADLMMVASNEVEDAICRLAQMARAAGLHLIIATQRPSVDVITGLIKANVPSRIAFNVSSGTDSRTIIDMNGAEKLLGKGDMLFYPVGYPKPVRIQGAFISDHEVENIVEYLKTQQQTQYNQKVMNHLNKSEDAATSGESKDELDELFADALELVVDKERASASLLQRYFRIGFNRAARLLDQMAEAGYVGEEQGSKPREVLLTRREWEQLKAKASAEPAREQESDGLRAGELPEHASERTQPIGAEEGQEGFELEPQTYERGTGESLTAGGDKEMAAEELYNDAINDMLEEMQSRS